MDRARAVQANPSEPISERGDRQTRSERVFSVPLVTTGKELQSGRRSESLFGILLLVITAFVQVWLYGCAASVPAPVDSRDGYAPAPPGFYRIRDGDSLSSIAIRRGLDQNALAQWNKLDPPYRIYSGKLLRVEPPAGRATPTSLTAGKARKKAPMTGSSSTAKAVPKPSGSVDGAKADGIAGLHWQWPLNGNVVQTFRRGDRTRQGVRIAGSAGQDVAAAEGGTVVYSGGGLKGYGNLIIVKHNDSYLSAYGFNRRLLVSEGQRVKRGQRVAEVGQASGGEYLLHFEIRKNGTAVDPLRYLPKSTASRAR